MFDIGFNGTSCACGDVECKPSYYPYFPLPIPQYCDPVASKCYSICSEVDIDRPSSPKNGVATECACPGRTKISVCQPNNYCLDGECLESWPSLPTCPLFPQTATEMCECPQINRQYPWDYACMPNQYCFEDRNDADQYCSDCWSYCFQHDLPTCTIGQYPPTPINWCICECGSSKNICGPFETCKCTKDAAHCCGPVAIFC